ncbi:MAG: HipA N-terminal domain-containing protein [Bacteroidota bacterium]
MRKAKVIYKDEEAGILTQFDDGSFSFRYLDAWLQDVHKSAISLTFPKTKSTFHSKVLFPFFFHMLPEGSNKQVICAHHRLDSDDHFGLLLKSAYNDTIGAVRILKVDA